MDMADDVIIHRVEIRLIPFVFENGILPPYMSSFRNIPLIRRDLHRCGTAPDIDNKDTIIYQRFLHR